MSKVREVLLRVDCQPGDAVLAIQGNRFVLCRGPVGSVGVFELLQDDDPRSFFSRCLQFWSIGGSAGDIVAGDVGVDQTAVVAFGRGAAMVRTTSEDVRVDANEAMLLADRVIRGSLIDIACGGPIADSGFWFSTGMIRVGSFRISQLGGSSAQASLQGDVSTPAEPQFATPRGPRRVEPMPESKPKVSGNVDPAPAPVPVFAVQGDFALHRQEMPEMPVELPPMDPIEDLDVTVWPARPNVVVGMTAVVEEEQPAASPSSPAGTSDVTSPPSLRDEYIEVVSQACDEVEDGNESTVLWSPTAQRLPADDQEDIGDRTMLASDVEKYRREPVRLVDQRSVVESDSVAGARCAAGHFTDGTKVRCIFCSGEVDFDRFETGSRPLLGTLIFDSGETVELVSSVVVGRKPSIGAGDAFRVVSFPEDRKLSRVHAVVKLTDWDVVVIDKQSANGTQISYPDGRVVAARPNFENVLEVGAVVRFGNQSFTFRRST